MLIRQHRAAIVLTALLAQSSASVALAQAASPWVDPPEDLGTVQEPVAPGDATSSVESAPVPLPPDRPETDIGVARPSPPRTLGTETAPTGHAALAEDARALAAAYLETWSAPNEMMLEAMGRFYAATIRFHGRVLSARALLDEKRRFVRRWPERDYQHRPESMKVACNPDTMTCQVRSVFDFQAKNPRRRLHSEGVAALDLLISLKGEQAVIVAENSEVLSRNRGRGPLDPKGRPDD